MIKVFFLMGAALLLTGCAASGTPDDIRNYLDENSTCYRITGMQHASERLDPILERLQQKVLISRIPVAKKRELCFLFGAARLVLESAGINRDFVYGKSGIALEHAGNETPLFLTRRVWMNTGKEAPPGIRNLFGRSDMVVGSSLLNLPADTVFAAEVNLDAQNIAGAVRTLVADSPLHERALIPAQSVSGFWRITARPGTDGELCWELDIPDAKGEITGCLKKSFPAVLFDRDIPVPIHGRTWTFRLSEKTASAPETGMKISIRMGKPLPLPSRTLADRQDVRRLWEAFPSGEIAGKGYFFVTPEFFTHLQEMPLDRVLSDYPMAIGVFSDSARSVRTRSFFFEPEEPAGFFSVISVSTWDPVSGETILPALLSGKRILSFLLKKADPVPQKRSPRQDFDRCGKQLETVNRALQTYARRHQGKFPAENNVEGLRELLNNGLLSPELLVCPEAAGDTPAKNAADFSADHCSYVYIGGSSTETPENFPLLMDWPLNHRNAFHIITVKGKILKISAPDLNSCRKAVSILQSRFRYPGEDFQKLLRVADELDREFLDAHSN